MEYLLLLLIMLVLLLLTYFGSKKQKYEVSSTTDIKRSIITSILINTLILTSLILIKMKGTIYDIVFLWVINFIIPYLGFQRLFKE